MIIKQNVINFNKQKICITLCMFIGEIWLRSWSKRFRFISCFKIIIKSFLQRFFSLTTKLLYSFFDLSFLSLISNWERFIIAECSVLLTWSLWLPRRLFLFFGASLSKTSTKLLSKVQYSSELCKLCSLRFRFSTNWKSVYVTFWKSR